ncbi:peroxisomal biogenesis factor 1 L homeolog isoform X1 [Xenopus laevis]|uniref:Peroxisomal ATPase PEX1 n=1 Tax=Xenopus laevis TaxID=8355 RepID=A0A8J0VEN8_XENLA|nr:peroxisomal biogenesis factor 1 L homeolog isoform X1 [Xenopus laevis]
MLGPGPAGAVVSLKLTSTKDTFMRLTPEVIAQLRLEQNHAVEVSWSEQMPVYLCWMESRSGTCLGTNVAELNRQFAEKLGFSHGQQVFLKQCTNVISCTEVTVEPLSADDWDILELHASALESRILDQIRIVYPKAIFPVWVDQHTCIYLQIGALTPLSSYGRLEPLTELVVAPKLRDLEAVSSALVPPGPEDLDIESSHVKSDHKQSESTDSRRQSTEGGSETIEPDHSEGLSSSKSIWDSVGNFLLRSLWRKPTLSASSSETELMEKSLVKKVELEAVFRVSNHIPHIVKNSQEYTDSVNDNCVHVFSWYPEPPGLVNDIVVTYGTIQELLSPKRRKESTRKNTDPSGKKMDGVALGNPKQRNADNKGPSATVKIAWHGFDGLKDIIEYDIRNGNTHVGKVWVPSRLRKKLNMNVSSAVRIHSRDCILRLPASLTLQPTQSLDRNIHKDDIKSAFTTWLLSSSTLQMPWIAGKTGYIQISLKDEVSEFFIVVDKTDLQSSQDDFYMLCPSVLEKTTIHVNSELAPTEEPQTHLHTDQNLLYLKLQNLGGGSKLGKSCYDHVVCCLMGSPLSRQLVASASGLRSGGVLLFGPKGSGKSTLAKALLKEASEKLESHVEEIDCKLLKGKTFENILQTLEEAFEEAAWRQPSIILLDDLDQITGAVSTPEMEQSSEASQSKQLAYVLKDLMKKIISMDTLVSVIATCQSEHSLNPVLISEQGTHLFQCVKAIPPPTQEERSEMLCCVMENRLSTDAASYRDLDFQYLARETEGFVARDFTIIVERAIESSVSTRRIFRKQDLALSMTDFQKALKGFTPLSLRNAQLHKPKKQGWNMVGGLHDVRQVLKDTVELPAKYPELFANLPIRHRSGVLLYGAPGTGKTLLAGVIAHESRMNFISIKGPELLSKYIGASEQAVRDVFTRAQAAKPCILFFDEFDSIAPRRGHDNTGVTDRVVNQMLTQLDGVEGLQGVYVLAATSRPDLIDPALLRPGRLDECLYCPPPDQASRLEILKGLSHSMLLDENVDLKLIASLTDHFTGADLKALLYNAQLEAIHTNLSATLPQDNNSGSDSDMSLSSIIFLNHSSASDDSGGDQDSVLDQSLPSLDMIKLPTEDIHSSMWRLYFGSSYDSDLGNCSSEQTSQSLSGSNSITHEFIGPSIGELVPSQPLVFISSSPEDHQQHSQEQYQKLDDEISVPKANCMNVVYDSHSQRESKKSLLIKQHHLMNALASTRPSVSQEDWKFFNHLYENFQNPKQSNRETWRSGQKVTLA